MRLRILLLVLSIQAVGCGASQSPSDAGHPNDAGPEATFCAALLDDFCALNAGKGVTDSNCQSFVTVSGFFECGDSVQDFDGNATAGCLSALGNAVDGGTGSFLAEENERAQPMAREDGRSETASGGARLHEFDVDA